MSSSAQQEPEERPAGASSAAAPPQVDPGLAKAPSPQVTSDDVASDKPRFDDKDIEWDRNSVLRTLGNISSSLTSSEYSSGLSVNEKRGTYKFDCSGMAYWVLRKAAPRAARFSAQGLERRPLARDFQRRIARIAPGEPKYGWQRIEKVRDLEPGDVVAWIKPPEIRSPNTGHIAFVLLPPLRLRGYANAYLLRIADSSRLLHDEDTRSERDGFGFGTILLVADPVSGEPIAYGWVAEKGWTFETQIALGRPEH